ncbi:MAG: hypothetical protein HQL21_08630 [Candidatus Omnitrophica bacterium]|nr:hypothetical protein [Candidatus Omnitrophota bacterium]
MKQISQKKQPSIKSLKKERISDLPKYEDKPWQVPKYGLKNTPSDKSCGCG